MSVTVVRLRPTSSSRSGRSEAQDIQIATAATGSADVVTLDVRFTLDVPREYLDDESWSENLVATMQPGDSLIIDTDFDRSPARSSQVADVLVSKFLTDDPIRMGTFPIGVIAQRIPSEADELFYVLEDPELASRVVILDTEATDAAGAVDTEFAEAFAHAVRSCPKDVPPLTDAFIRRRGVFRHDSARESYYQFYYEAQAAGAETIRSTLAEYLRGVAPAIVVVDDTSSGPWFNSAVKGASVDVQIDPGLTLTPAGLTMLEAARAAASSGKRRALARSEYRRALAILERIDETDESILLIAPAVQSGRSIGSAHEALGSPALSRMRFLAVFSDEANPWIASERSPAHGTTSKPYGSKTLDIDFLARVELRTIHPESWLVKSARATHQLQRMPVEPIDGSPVSMVAMWSLFEECGVGIEKVPARGRAPLRHFPDLGELSDWDSRWLGELVVQNVLRLLPRANREAFLAVMPDEPNGTPPLADGLQRSGVDVLMISREVIDGKASLDAHETRRLREHEAGTILVFDESTVTYGTLERLRSVASSVVPGPDVMGVVMDLAGTRPNNDAVYFSLARWRAVAVEEGQA